MQKIKRDKNFTEKLYRIVFTILLISLLNPTTSCPQQIQLVDTAAQSQAKVLSLNDCIKIALENNHKIKASEQGVNIADARKKQAESGYWPQLSAKAAYTLMDQDPLFILPGFKINLPSISFLGMDVNIGNFNVPQQNVKLMDKQNINAGVELTYPIYTGGKVQALNTEAENGIEIAKQDFRKNNLQVEYDVKRFFYAAVLAKKIYKISTEALERLEMTLSLTENMYKNGSGKTTKLDYLKNKVIVDQVRTIVNEFKKNVGLSKDALAFTLGTHNKFEVPDVEIPFNNDSLKIEMLLKKAYNNNPEYAQANAAELVFKAKTEEAFSGYLPNIALIGSFNQNFNSYKYGVVNKENSTMWMIGVGAEIPIFNGFRTANEVGEAEARLKELIENKNLLHDAIALQIKAAFSKVETSSENVKNTLEAKTTAAENRSLNERAFKQEMAEAKDLIEAQIMESLMNIQYQKALYDHLEAESNLELLTGSNFIKN